MRHTESPRTGVRAVEMVAASTFLAGIRVSIPRRNVMDLKQAIGAALAAGAFVAIPVIAADSASDSEANERADQVFTRLDKNNDGNLDPAEAQARPWLQQGFSQYDTNHDGKLGKDEVAAPHSAQRNTGLGASTVAGAGPNRCRYFSRKT